MADKPILTKVVKDSDLKKEKIDNVKRQSITVESKTIISQPPKPQVGYSVSDGTKINNASPQGMTKGEKRKNATNNSDASTGGGSSGSGIRTVGRVENDSQRRIPSTPSKEPVRKPLIASSKTVISQPHLKTGMSDSVSRKPDGKKEDAYKVPHGEEEQNKNRNTGAKAQQSQNNLRTQRQITINTSPRTAISRPNVVKVPVNLKGGFKEINNLSQKALNSQDDVGANTVSYALTGSVGVVKVVKNTQKVSDAIVKKTAEPIKTGIKGVYKVGKGTVRVVRAVDSKVGMIKAGHIKLDKDTVVGMKNVAVHNIKTASKNIAKAVAKKAPRSVIVGTKVIKTGVVGAYKVGKGTIRVVRTVDSKIGMIKAGHIKLDKNTAIRLKNMAVGKIVNSKVASLISYGVYGVRTSITRKVNSVKSGIRTAKGYVVKVGNGVVKTAVLARGIANGTIKVRISKDTLKGLGQRAIPIIGKGFKLGAKGVGKTIKAVPGVIKKGSFIAHGVVKGGKFISNGSVKIGKGLNTVGDVFTNSNSFEAQTVGYGMKSIHYTIKGIRSTPRVAKVGYRGVKTSVKTVYKGGKFVVKTGVGTYRYIKTGVRVARKAGVKKALKMYSKRWAKSFKGKSIKALRKAGGSVVNLFVDLLKKAGTKILVPLLVVVFGVGGMMLVVSGASSFVTSLLSPFLSDDSGNQIDEVAWLTSKITTARAELVEEVKQIYHNNLSANHGNYEYVRFYNSIEDIEIELTDTNIANNLYSVSEYLENIEPIFHSIMISEYGLKASEGQMKNVFNEIWDCVSVIDTEPMPTEYCNMIKTDNVDGTYTITPVTDVDGIVHADMSIPCPRHAGIYYHSNPNFSNPLCDCDYYYWSCQGHKSSNTSCGMEEHGHTWECCSIPTHAMCTYQYCDAYWPKDSNGNYIGDVCSRYHDHNFSACNTSNCGNKPVHSHQEWVSATNQGCYYTDYCSTVEMSSPCTNSTKNFKCMGYYRCDGHRVLKLSIELEGFGELLDKYFLNEINQLESRANPTVDEQRRLNELRDYYEICLEYQSILASEYGVGGGTIVSLDGVTLTEITDFACQFIGNPYVWGGTDPNTGADCSGFVQYVYAHFGVSLPRVSRDQVGSGIIISSIDNAQPGDLIFWSDNGMDSGVHHVAIYLGNGLLVHASNSAPYPNGGIKVSNVYGTIHKIKRVVNN